MPAFGICTHINIRNYDSASADIATPVNWTESQF